MNPTLEHAHTLLWEFYISVAGVVPQSKLDEIERTAMELCNLLPIIDLGDK